MTETSTKSKWFGPYKIHHPLIFWKLVILFFIKYKICKYLSATVFFMFLFVFYRHRSCSQTWYGRIYCRRSCDSRSSFIIFRSSKMVLGLAIKRSICFIGKKISLLDNAPNFDESENKPRPDYNNIPINIKLKHF